MVYDADGKRYLDLLGGIAVNILGHAHPAIIEAVTTQLATLGHTSNLYATEPVIALAEQLLAHVGAIAGRVFLCNSGTEANEAAFKIARSTGRRRSSRHRTAFHGRTMGALALTGQPTKRAPFEPMPPGVVHVPYGDVDALRAEVDESTAAVFLEPIMGEGGVVVPPEGYLVAAREITARTGALLVLDEVQTGIGRTGWFYAHQAIRHRARRHHPGQGSRRRLADRGLHRAPALRPNCSDRACTAPPSAATRSARPPRSRCCARSPRRT